jgi:hypothetical protein
MKKYLGIDTREKMHKVAEIEELSRMVVSTEEVVKKGKGKNSKKAK